MWLLFFILGPLLHAESQVSEVVEQGKQIKVTESPDVHAGTTACVYHQEEAISCGKIAECQEGKCSVEVMEQVEDVLLGDLVKPYKDTPPEQTSPPTSTQTGQAPTEGTTVAQAPTLERGERQGWDLSKKPETRLEIIRYHRELIRQNDYSRPSIYTD